jgi:hypothetical protein
MSRDDYDDAYPESEVFVMLGDALFWTSKIQYEKGGRMTIILYNVLFPVMPAYTPAKGATLFAEKERTTYFPKITIANEDGQCIVRFYDDDEEEMGHSVATWHAIDEKTSIYEPLPGSIFDELQQKYTERKEERDATPKKGEKRKREEKHMDEQKSSTAQKNAEGRRVVLDITDSSSPLHHAYEGKQDEHDAEEKAEPVIDNQESASDSQTLRHFSLYNNALPSVSLSQLSQPPSQSVVSQPTVSQTGGKGKRSYHEYQKQQEKAQVVSAKDEQAEIDARNARLDELVEKQKTGSLSMDESAELDSLLPQSPLF